MKVYIGYDPAEGEAASVCAKSLTRVTHNKLQPEFLCAPKLYSQGLLTRRVDRRGHLYDLVSNEQASTEFKISRFLVPLICQGGFALFLDCDMVFYTDPREMLLEIDSSKAVSVVKHEHVPGEQWKMVNRSQKTYPRKNWSSVMVFNCDHPANRRLSLRDVNERTAEELHTFYWLHDDEIGALSPRWNWLVNVQPRPPMVGIAHFTLGGPWLAGWAPAEHDEMWEAARDA